MGDVVEEKESVEHMRGYVAGMSEGDGTLWQSWNRSGSKSWRFRLVLWDDEPVEYFSRCLDVLGIKWHWGNYQTYGHKDYIPDTLIRKRALWITDDFNAKKIKDLEDLEDVSDEFVRGWLAGIFDAEGSACGGKCIRISQLAKNLKVKDKIVKFLKRRGLRVVEAEIVALQRYLSIMA